MTNDPKRWSEDDEAPAELRAYLRDASAAEVTLPAALRTQMREALMNARDENAAPDAPRPSSDERPVAAPIDLASRRAGPAIAFGFLAAAIILLGVVLYGSEPLVTPPSLPAVEPEPIDAGPDAPPLDVIDVELVCGDREDSDRQCDLVVRPRHSYERIELHAAVGIRPPDCSGTAEQHREPADGDQRFVLSDGASDAASRAFTVCGYSGGVLMGTGSVEGERSLPWMDLAPRRGGDDVRISLDALDDDIERLELRWLAPSPDAYSELSDGCPGELVASMHADDLEPLVGHEGLAWFRHVQTPETRPTLVLCGFSDAGVVHARMIYRFPDDDQPFVRTVSDELPLGEFRGDLLVLGPDGIVSVTHIDSHWPGSATNRRAANRLSARMDETNATPTRTLLLANGQTLTLPRGARLGPRSPGEEPRVATLRDGTTSAIVREVVIGAEPTDGEDLHQVARDALLTSSSEACIYLDDVVVALFATGAEPPVPVAPEASESIRVVPQVADECHVEVLLEVDALPEGIESVAIAYVHAASGVDLDIRPPMDCAAASIALELPASAIAALVPDAPGVRQLALTFSDAPDDFDDLRDVGTYCSAPYAVIACVRDASGLHALPGATGRWTYSGMACFAGDTPIATEDGSVPIASLRPGARVWAFDPNRGATVLTTVRRLIPRGERLISTFSLADGTALRVTGEHPLFDAASRVFRRAETFEVGDRLRGIDGRDVVVIGIDDRGERAQVFDLSVAGPHTYFAGGIVAHNY